MGDDLIANQILALLSLTPSYLFCSHAEVSWWSVVVRPHHHNSQLELGFSSSHSEPYLLPRMGCFTAPLQRHLKTTCG